MPFEFEYSGNSYKYECGDLLYKNKYGHYSTLCELNIEGLDSHSREVQEKICIAAIQAYRQGIVEGQRLKMVEIRRVIGAEGNRG